MVEDCFFCRAIVVCCLAAGSSACGGRAEQTAFDGRLDVPADYGASGEPANDTSEQPSNPSYSAGGSQMLPEYPDPSSTQDQCAGPPSSLGTKLLWELAVPLYGIDATPYFAFSGDGSKLMIPTDEYGRDGNAILAADDGAPITGPEVHVLGRDAAWSRELRGTDPFSSAGDVSVVDIGPEQTLLSLGPVSRLVSLSADGNYVFGVYCNDGDRLERRRISDGEVTVVPLSAELSPCSINNGVGSANLDMPFVVSSSNDSAAFLSAQTHELVLVSVSAGTTRAHAAYEASPSDGWPRTDTAISLAFSPIQRALATVNGAGTLRIWSSPGLVQSLPDIQLSVTHAFRNCYCGRRDFAPVVWSPDERYLATADEAGNTVLRHACDGSVVTTLQAPKQASFLDGYAQGPAFIAFTPNGRGLAVLSISEVYDGTLSYYELSE
jgi:WD40 repeat protein